ncbi:hypothetical protein CRYUN_Cryun36dG0007300 [Craigia yunnanensis]
MENHSSTIPVANPVLIFSPQFCAPYAFDLEIVRKVLTKTNGNFVVDILGIIVFMVKGAFLTMHGRQVLLDAAGIPLSHSNS